MEDLVIETTGLRKLYGAKVAVADLTLDLPKGEVFGFLGPNGAGKSTSVKMLLGLAQPSGGTARVLGQPPGHTATMGRIGFLPKHFRFHEWLQAGEFLDLHGRLYGMSVEARRRRVPELLDMVGLGDQGRTLLSGFSKGMLQRIGLAQALINRPDLVFLDEPTSALDPFGRMLVRGVIRELKAQGTTIFLNSHLLGEVEATCDRVSFIKNGAVIRTLSLATLGEGHMDVELRVDDVTPELLGALGTIPGVTLANGAALSPNPATHPYAATGFIEHGSTIAVAGATQTILELTVANEETLPVLAERIVASGARLYGLTPRRVSLEQLFLEIVGREDSGQ